MGSNEISPRKPKRRSHPSVSFRCPSRPVPRGLSLAAAGQFLGFPDPRGTRLFSAPSAVLPSAAGGAPALTPLHRASPRETEGALRPPNRGVRKGTVYTAFSLPCLHLLRASSPLAGSPLAYMTCAQPRLRPCLQGNPDKPTDNVIAAHVNDRLLFACSETLNSAWPTKVSAIFPFLAIKVTHKTATCSVVDVVVFFLMHQDMVFPYEK